MIAHHFKKVISNEDIPNSDIDMNLGCDWSWSWTYCLITRASESHSSEEECQQSVT